MSSTQARGSTLKLQYASSKYPYFIAYRGSCQNRSEEYCTLTKIRDSILRFIVSKYFHWIRAGSTIHFCKAGSHWAKSSSENQRAISLADDWTESAPWMIFIVLWPKSPRILPISALHGLVAPIILLHSLTASWNNRICYEKINTMDSKKKTILNHKFKCNLKGLSNCILFVSGQ